LKRWFTGDTTLHRGDAHDPGDSKKKFYGQEENGTPGGDQKIREGDINPCKSGKEARASNHAKKGSREGKKKK